MPGIRDRKLRSGDLCEGLGLQLLRLFALVAPATFRRCWVEDNPRVFPEDFPVVFGSVLVPNWSFLALFGAKLSQNGPKLSQNGPK